ncbi:MAG: peptidylprolyl isomerase [Gammaproteobacteria bacterium]|nr:peptidylprolyl isomerase [Gammaproteobacteria bacterium]
MKFLNFHSTFGDVSILMHLDHAPETCQYFIDLTRNGAFEPASIFRIVTTSGIQQAQDSQINVLQIGPLQRFEGPRHLMTHENTQQTGITHRKWVVSAARFDLGELYGSFFICLKDQPQLDYGGSRQPDGQGFAAFGKVVNGFDALEHIFLQAEASELLSQQIPISHVAVSEQGE